MVTEVMRPEMIKRGRLPALSTKTSETENDYYQTEKLRVSDLLPVAASWTTPTMKVQM